MNRLPLTTYHLYHYTLEPLAPDAISPERWLINNGATYTMVATIEANTESEAFLAIQEKLVGCGKRQRWVTWCTANLLRTTSPGDVFVGEKAAWMVISPEK